MTSTSYINYPSDRLSKRRGSGRTSIQTLLFCLWFSKQESFLKSCCGKSSINVFFPSILRNRREGDLWCPILWFDPLPQGVEEIKRIFVALCVTGYTGNKNFRSCGVWFFYRNAGRVGPQGCVWWAHGPGQAGCGHRTNHSFRRDHGHVTSGPPRTKPGPVCAGSMGCLSGRLQWLYWGHNSPYHWTLVIMK